MNPVIITFVSEAYIPVGRNWLDAVIKLETGCKVMIVALDEMTRDSFPDGIVSYRPSISGDLDELWIHRMIILRELLDQGIDVLHSDADAVWVRDPLPLIRSCGTEMVFSQGTIWPPDVHARHGIVLCCGLFYMQSTPAVRAFIAAVQQRVELDKDDQISINRLVDEGLTRWVIRQPYTIEFGHNVFTASRSVMYAKMVQEPSLSVLPHHSFPRLLTTVDEDVYVGHPLSGKTCADKVKILSALGLWNGA